MLAREERDDAIRFTQFLGADNYSLVAVERHQAKVVNGLREARD